MSMFSYHILNREHIVYPGHPITIAYCIVNRYGNWTEATAKKNKNFYYNALTDPEIPGAAANVSNALYILRLIKDGMSFSDACKHAERMWQFCDGQAEPDPKDPGKLERYYKGTLQAVKYRDNLKEILDDGWLV